MSGIDSPIDSDYNLKERMKELECLYSITKLLRISKKPHDEILQEMLYLIQSAMEFPQLTSVRISMGDKMRKKKKNYFLENKQIPNEKVDLIDDIGSRLKTFLLQRIKEEELSASEKKFKNIFTESPIGIELYDSKGIFG